MPGEPDETEQVHLEARASGEARIFQAGRDQHIAERDLHLHFEDGVHGARHAEPGVGTACPYPGLAPFDTEQARWFFGRDKLVAELVTGLADRLASGGPLVLVAPSGAGKSSVLRAGLLPALARGALPVPGSEHWPRVVFTPTARPLAAAADRLATVLGAAPEAVAEMAGEAPGRLVAALREALRSTAAPGDGSPRPGIVVVVDQAEELFTLCEDKHERCCFLDLMEQLSAAAPGTAPAALVVLGLRIDFYGRLAGRPGLRSALQTGQVIVQPLSEEGLRQAILFPARAAGLNVEPGLVELLLRDLRTGDGGPDGPYETGRLPLLAHALRATWQARHGSTMTVEAYRVAGGVEGAVCTTADRVYDALDSPGRQMARTLFLRLIRLGDDGARDSRRRPTRSELLRDLPEAAVPVLDAFVRGRLLTQRQDTVEITHDALLRAWPRLGAWITEDKAGLLLHQQLADAAEAWQRAGRDRGSLYRGRRLAAARGWAEAPRNRAALAPLERDFLRAGVRDRAVRRLGLGTAALGVVAALVAGMLAAQQHQAAARRQAVITSRSLAAEAAEARTGDPLAALQLSLAAYRLSPTPEARTELYASYTTPYPIVLDDPTAKVRPGPVLSVAFSADGRSLASSDNSHTLRLWNVSDPLHPVLGASLATSGTAAVAFGPRGHLLAAHGRHSLLLWDVADPRRPRLLSSTVTATPVAYSVAFSPDGGTLAVGGSDGAARLWDVSDPAHPRADRTLPSGGTQVTSVAFRPGTPRILAAASMGGSVRLWDLSSRGAGPLTVLHAKSATSVAFGAGGRILAAGGTFGQLNAWNVTDPRRPVVVNLVAGPEAGNGDITATAFGPDGADLVAAATDGHVSRYLFGRQSGSALTDPEKLPDFSGSVAARAVAVAPDGSTVATGNDDGKVRVWTTPAPPLIPHSLASRVGGDAPGSVFGDGGRVLATNDWDTSAQLWDISDRRHPALAATLPRPWTHAAFLSDGRTLVTTANKGTTVRLWDARDPRRPTVEADLHVPAAGGKGTVRMDASAESHLVALNNSVDTVVHLWDIRDPRHPVEVASVTNPRSLNGLGLQQHGRVLVTFDGYARVRLWDLTEPRRPDGPAVLPDSDGTIVLLGTAARTMAGMVPNRTVRLWDVSDSTRPISVTPGIDVKAEAIQTVDDRVLAVLSERGRGLSFWALQGHGHSLIDEFPLDSSGEDLISSNDGRALALTTQLDRILLWHISDLTGMSETDAVAVPGFDAEFGPGGSWLAVSVDDSFYGPGVRLWETDPDRLYRDICATVGNLLPPDQWAKHIHLPYQRPCP